MSNKILYMKWLIKQKSFCSTNKNALIEVSRVFFLFGMTSKNALLDVTSNIFFKSRD